MLAQDNCLAYEPRILENYTPANFMTSGRDSVKPLSLRGSKGVFEGTYLERLGSSVGNHSQVLGL